MVSVISQELGSSFLVSLLEWHRFLPLYDFQTSDCESAVRSYDCWFVGGLLKCAEYSGLNTCRMLLNMLVLCENVFFTLKKGLFSSFPSIKILTKYGWVNFTG